MNDEMFNSMVDTFYRGRPCSYHFTKSLAEHLIAQEASRGFYYYNQDCNDQFVDQPELSNNRQWRPFPAAIVRPSIICAAWKEPFPGWIDNYNGISGFLVVNGNGVLRSMHVIKEYLSDVIPVDVVINTCITSAWYVAVKQNKCNLIQPTKADMNNVLVVNCVSGICFFLVPKLLNLIELFSKDHIIH